MRILFDCDATRVPERHSTKHMLKTAGNLSDPQEEELEVSGDVVAVVLGKCKLKAQDPEHGSCEMTAAREE